MLPKQAEGSGFQTPGLLLKFQPKGGITGTIVQKNQPKIHTVTGTILVQTKRHQPNKTVQPVFLEETAASWNLRNDKAPRWTHLSCESVPTWFQLQFARALTQKKTLKSKWKKNQHVRIQNPQTFKCAMMCPTNYLIVYCIPTEACQKKRHLQQPSQIKHEAKSEVIPVASKVG